MIAHSQGTAIWASAIEQYQDDEVARRLDADPGADEALIRQQVQGEMSELLTVEALSPIEDFPPGPRLIRYENEGDGILDVFGLDDEDGITVTSDWIRERHLKPNLTSGHDISDYLRLRAAALADPLVQEVFERP